MAVEKVWFVVDFAIEEGKFEAFESLARLMSAETEKEPGALVYEWFLSSDRKQCRLVEEYIDEKAVLAHLTGRVVQEMVPKLLESSKLAGFEVYGNPGPEASAMLLAFGATIFGPWQGFSR